MPDAERRRIRCEPRQVNSLKRLRTDRVSERPTDTLAGLPHRPDDDRSLARSLARAHANKRKACGTPVRTPIDQAWQRRALRERWCMDERLRRDREVLRVQPMLQFRVKSIAGPIPLRKRPNEPAFLKRAA